MVLRGLAGARGIVAVDTAGLRSVRLLRRRSLVTRPLLGPFVAAYATAVTSYANGCVELPACTSAEHGISCARHTHLSPRRACAARRPPSARC